jgi:YggT family protein
MFGQIAIFLIDTVVSFIVLLLLARFHFQWLRVPFRNPVGEFLVATTNWIVLPARRVIPGLAGLDLATLLTAWMVQALGLWAKLAIAGSEPGVVALLAVAALELVRFSVYILVFALIVQAVFSWVNPSAPLAWIFNAMTQPFLRPLRRFIPPVGGIDLTPLVLIVALQVLIFPINYLQALAATL